MTKTSLRHPSEFGFKLALEAQFSEKWQPTIKYASEEASKLSDIVYVMIGKGGAYLRVGQTGGTLLQRWDRVLKKQIPAGNKGGSFREHEREFSKRFRAEKSARVVQFWIRPAHKVHLNYLGDDFQASARGAEEIYLDRYYQPILSVELEGRRTTKTSAITVTKPSGALTRSTPAR